MTRDWAGGDGDMKREDEKERPPQHGGGASRDERDGEDAHGEGRAVGSAPVRDAATTPRVSSVATLVVAAWRKSCAGIGCYDCHALTICYVHPW